MEKSKPDPRTSMFIKIWFKKFFFSSSSIWAQKHGTSYGEKYFADKVILFFKTCQHSLAQCFCEKKIRDRKAFQDDLH